MFIIKSLSRSFSGEGSDGQLHLTEQKQSAELCGQAILSDYGSGSGAEGEGPRVPACRPNIAIPWVLHPEAYEENAEDFGRASADLGKEGADHGLHPPPS